MEPGRGTEPGAETGRRSWRPADIAKEYDVQTLFDRFDRRGDAEQAPDQHARMTREQVVDRIITINPTATRAYLDRFDKAELGRYLARLTLAGSPRGRGAQGWIRTSVSPAIVSSRPVE